MGNIQHGLRVAIQLRNRSGGMGAAAALRPVPDQIVVAVGGLGDSAQRIARLDYVVSAS